MNKNLHWMYLTSIIKVTLKVTFGKKGCLLIICVAGNASTCYIKISHPSHEKQCKIAHI